MSDAAGPSAASVAGVWLHAFEEDAGKRMVFRRQSGPAPLARGRERLVLNADGSVEATRPGPDDRPQPVSGAWRERPGGEIEVELHGPVARSATRCFRRDGPDRLVVDR